MVWELGVRRQEWAYGSIDKRKTNKIVIPENNPVDCLSGIGLITAGCLSNSNQIYTILSQAQDDTFIALFLLEIFPSFVYSL